MAIDWEPFPNNLAANMSPKLKDLLEGACRKLGYAYNKMPSGAGHDTLNMAKLGEVGMLFIPCEGGRSHCPEEYAAMEDIQKGVEVLKQCLYQLAYEDVLKLEQSSADGSGH